uniref:Uncharacterized protein n=1 Tax=Arundo donax TaxID=35708 RepID=A0A0A9E9G1_ARUDO
MRKHSITSQVRGVTAYRLNHKRQ